MQEKMLIKGVNDMGQVKDPCPPKQVYKQKELNLQAQDLLNEVSVVLQERGKVYDTVGEFGQERSMEKIVALFNLRTGLNLTETQGWIFMGYLKDVRQDSAGGKHHDSAIDKVSYALLEAEARFRGRRNTE